MEVHTEIYRGLEIHIQVFDEQPGMAAVACRLVDIQDSQLSPITAEVMNVPGGPYPADIAERIGVAYCMGVIDGYFEPDDAIPHDKPAPSH